MCALLIWFPQEKIQVTESLLKQAPEKRFICFFCLKVIEGKTGNKQDF